MLLGGVQSLLDLKEPHNFFDGKRLALDLRVLFQKPKT
jgi:hypothetical protein